MSNSKPKHTPGPWRISGVGPKGSIRKIFYATDTTSYPVATVQLDNLDRFGTGDTDATAALISAAPEMFEALWACLNNFEIRENSSNFSNNYELGLIRRAIAKATGGKS